MSSRAVLGIDGSAHARRAAAFLARLKPAGRAVVVRVVEPVRPSTTGLLPETVRGRILGQAARLEAQRRNTARREVEAVARRLMRSGWRVRGEVRSGVPLAELTDSVRAARADLLVLGARGVGGMTRFLLGSVADGALRRTPCAVLIVR